MVKEKLINIKNRAKEFGKKHKKAIGIGVGSIAVVVLAIIAKSKKDSSTDNLGYSNKFFRNASDEELAIEREKVRLKRNSSYGTEYDKYYNLLDKFDNVISKRAWGNEEPKAPSYHSEHGWYLPEDDE